MLINKPAEKIVLDNNVLKFKWNLEDGFIESTMKVEDDKLTVFLSTKYLESLLTFDDLCIQVDKILGIYDFNVREQKISKISTFIFSFDTQVSEVLSQYSGLKEAFLWRLKQRKIYSSNLN